MKFSAPLCVVMQVPFYSVRILILGFVRNGQKVMWFGEKEGNLFLDIGL